MTDKDTISEVLRVTDLIQPAADELRLSLNDIIAKHNINPHETLAILARLTAAYIQLTQKQVDAMGIDDVVEEDYQMMLSTYLTDIDMQKVVPEMDKINREMFN